MLYGDVRSCCILEYACIRGLINDFLAHSLEEMQYGLVTTRLLRLILLWSRVAVILDHFHVRKQYFFPVR